MAIKQMPSSKSAVDDLAMNSVDSMGEQSSNGSLVLKLFKVQEIML
jgi:hypothetical protein